MIGSSCCCFQDRAAYPKVSGSREEKSRACSEIPTAHLAHGWKGVRERLLAGNAGVVLDASGSLAAQFATARNSQAGNCK